jgi:hypothetical protein
MAGRNRYDEAASERRGLHVGRTGDAEDTIANWRDFWDVVRKARVPGLEVKRGEIDETHAGSWPHTMVKGAKAVPPRQRPQRPRKPGSAC